MRGRTYAGTGRREHAGCDIAASPPITGSCPQIILAPLCPLLSPKTPSVLLTLLFTRLTRTPLCLSECGGLLFSSLVILSTYGLPPPPPILPLSLVFVCVICDEYLLSFNRHRLLILGGGDGRGRGLSTLFPLCMQGPFIRFCVYFGIEHSLWERKSSCFVLNNVLFLCVAGKANGFGVSFECPL